MGSSINPKTSQSKFINDYNIIMTDNTNKITNLQHKITKQQYLLRQINLIDKKQVQKLQQKLQKQKSKHNRTNHIAGLSSYQIVKEDQYCSNNYRVYLLFQFCFRTLQNQINQRNIYHRSFTQIQLWSIIASCILGLSYLQKNQIPHSTLQTKYILLSQSGIIQITDPYALGVQTNLNTVFTDPKIPNIYLSPQQINYLHNQNANATYNKYQSDVWTIGMIILECGILQPQYQCYRDEYSRIHWETLEYNINRLGQKYSQDLKNMVEYMLNRNQKQRPDWITLQQYVVKNDSGRNSIVSDQLRKSKSIINLRIPSQFQNQASENEQNNTKNIKPHIQQQNLPYILPSNIQKTRPFKNVFPVSQYHPKTYFDQNIASFQYSQQNSIALNNSDYHHQNIDYQKQGYLFVQDQFKMGSKYIGYKFNGMRHGHGKFYYQDGAKYDGLWSQNKMQGYGKLYYQSGKIAYEGYWQKDQFMGKGTVYNQLPDSLQGAFDYRDMQQIGGCWIKYIGQFANDMKNGYGILYLSNGQKFEGHFIDDSIDGQGIFHCNNNKKINGKWRNNIKIQ